MASPLLQEYYRKYFRRTIVRTMTAGRVAIYDRAVALMVRFAGEGVRVLDVREELLSNFIVQGAERECTAKHRKELAGCLRRVVRHWRPDALRPARDRGDAPTPLQPGTLIAYFETIYLPRVLFASQAYVQAEYRGIIRSLTDHHGRDLLLAELNDAVAAGHLSWLLGQGLRRASVNKYRGCLFAVWRHAWRTGACPTEPRVPKLRADIEEPDAWTLSEVARLFSAAERFQPHRTYGGVPRNLYWHALLRIAYWTALRRGSLLGIRRDNIDRKSGWLYVPANPMKNRCGKSFRLGPDALEAIDKIWQPDRPLLFPRVDKSTLNEHFKLLQADALIAESPRCGLNRFHKLRRTVATHVAIKAGRHVASSLLGHSSLAVTNLYISPSMLPGNDFTEILPTLARVTMAHAAPTPASDQVGAELHTA